MASVAAVNILQDGVRALYIRKKVGGTPSGPFYKLAGVNSASTTRNVTERELPGDNVTFRKDSKFNDYEVALSLWTARPDLLMYFLGGTTTEVGDRTIFEEDANSQPTQFEMFIESDGVGEDSETVSIGEHYLLCNVSNFQNAKSSGEYTTFELTVTCTATSAGVSRRLIYDANELPFEMANDVTGALMASTTPSDGSTLATTGTAIDIVYAENMDATTAATHIEVFSNGVLEVEGTDYDATVSTVTISLTPTTVWNTGETIIVSVLPGLKTDAGVKIGLGYTLTFVVP